MIKQLLSLAWVIGFSRASAYIGSSWCSFSGRLIKSPWARNRNGGSTFHTNRLATKRVRSMGVSQLTMRDHSVCYWFRIGDQVQVVQDVIKQEENLRGRQGVVIETWEKCDVDPTCCCAEQVDRNFAVLVEFTSSSNATEAQGKGSKFTYYFAEDQLEKVSSEKASVSELDRAAVYGLEHDLPFDGMSCKAFKLEQLQLDTHPRRISFFEPRNADEA